MTNTNAPMRFTIDSGSIKWEANLQADFDSYGSYGVVALSTVAYDNPPSFEVTGSISNSGITPALYSQSIPITISGSGIVQNTRNRLADEIRYYDCAAIMATQASVTVKDNARVMATGGGSATIAYGATVSGGLVFGAGETMTGLEASNSVIKIANGYDLNVTGTGTIIGWNKSAGHTAYQTNSATDIIKQPAGTTAYWTTQNSQPGIAWQNSPASGFIPISGVSLDDTKPTVSSVLPSGTNIAGGGNVAITFSEAMDTQTAGTVQLNSLSALVAGTWSSDKKTYTALYSGLAASTTYTVNISGFADAAGNVMTAVTSGYTFTTDGTPPIVSVVSISNIQSNGATLNFTTDEAGTYYYMVLPAIDSAPNAAAVRAQGDATTKGSGSIAVGAKSVTANGLTTDAAYKFYVVVEDAIGNLSAVAVSDEFSATPNLSASVVITQSQSAAEIKAAIEAAFDTISVGGTVTVTGSKTNATESVVFSCLGKNVSWEATYTGSSAGTLLNVTTGQSGASLGTFEVNDGAYVSNSGTGDAVNFTSVNNQMIVSGGVVHADSGVAIRSSQGARINGGLITAKGNNALYLNNVVYGFTGGTIFAYGSALSNVVRVSSSNTNNANYNGTPGTGTGMVVAWDNTAGTTTYIPGAVTDIFKLPAGATAVWDVVGNVSGITYTNGANTGFIPVSEVTVTDGTDTTAPILTAGTVSRTSDTTATVKFTSNEAGQYYYQVVDDNAGDPNIDTSGAGTACGTSEVTLSPTLTAGAKDIWIYVKDAAGNIGKLKIDIPAYVAPDTTAPTGEIKLGTHGWNSFFNTITFGLFCKNTQTIEIEASDDSGGAVTVEYYLADAEKTEEQLASVTWTAYSSSFNIQPGKYVIYAKLTDTSGNSGIINTGGIVVYADSAQDTASISFTKGDAQDVTADVTLNGNTIAKIMNGTDTLTPTTDYTVNNTAGVITFKASYLDTLAAGSYTLTAYYNPQGMEYPSTPIAGSVAPATTTISLTVSAASGHTHTWGTNWEHDATNHWHECTANDGAKDGIAAHTPGSWIVDIAATATVNGSRHKECTVCGFVTETGTIPATGGGSDKDGYTNYVLLNDFGIYNGTGPVSARIGADYDDFIRLEDEWGNVIPEKYYSVGRGSTIITFTQAYLNTLAKGTY
ncbi:MAG: hypothetical protein LBN26_00790, partial [Christensenellaceae bacterium]|nr:hypothetical protein [Christensenellaceae bacterium]